MIITIYDRVGNPKADISANDSSTQVKEIQGDNVLTLSFTLYEHVVLDVDDYADFEGERYWLTEAYRPKQKSTMEWVYDLKLYGIESLIKNILVIKRVDGEDDPVFTLTAPPREHVSMIVNCMNDGMGGITDWKVGQVDGTENIVIDYHGKYCDEALREIAEKVGAEWWVEGQTVNVCRCEHGEPVALGYDKGLTSIDPGTANNVKFYTRLYPIGSSRNIDPEKYGHSRLQLPGGQKYVEINADKYGRVDHYEDVAFADIYPRRTGEVSSVRSEVKTGEDGKSFTIYYFRDNSLPFDPNDYEIGGLVKRISFQEGSELAGLGEEDNGTYYFEVNFNSSTREFEIITIWPYDNDTQLPGDKLVPKVGDKYILWNLRMPDEYYTLAEEEFLTAVNKYNADHNLDISVYKTSTDHVWIEDNNVELTIGSMVRLESEEYFPGIGFRDSRITRITRKVNLPSSMDLEIGDALSRTSLKKISDDIKDVRSYVDSRGASLPDIIKTGDSTQFTDSNLLSALRTLRDFMSKLRDDRSVGRIASDKGFEIGNFVDGVSGAVIRRNSDGTTYAEVDKLLVRMKAWFETLEILHTSSLAGEFIITPGGSIECIRVEERDGCWRCYFTTEQEGEKIENLFQPGDFAKCNSFNAKEGVSNKLTNKFYWRAVTGIGDDYIELSKSDCAAGSDVPEGGDAICHLGNVTDADRQTAMILSTVSGDAPSLKLFTGINTYSLEGREVIELGYDKASGKAFTRCYGDAYYGARDGSSFMRFTEGKGAEFRGVLHLDSTVGDTTLAELLKVAINDYLRKALVQSTSMIGGIVLTSAVLLGQYTKEDGRITHSGISGIFDTSKPGNGIAAFYGGDMIDKAEYYTFNHSTHKWEFKEGVTANTVTNLRIASTLFRMDGTGYLANGTIQWDNYGAGSVADGKLWWDKDGNVQIGADVLISGGTGNPQTMAALLNAFNRFNSMFERVENEDGTWYIKAKSHLVSVGEITAFGSDGSGDSVSGGATYLHDLLDVTLNNLSSGQSLVWDGTKWVNKTVSGGLDEVTLLDYLKTNGYATQSWVNENHYTKNDTQHNFVQALYADSCNVLRDMNDMLGNTSFIGSVTTSANAPNGNGWYNVIQLAHRNGADDGPGYVGQIALGMTVNHERMYYRTHRTRAWQTVARLTDLTWGNLTGKPTNFVTTDTDQLISGAKTMTSSLCINTDSRYNSFNEGIRINANSVSGWATTFFGGTPGSTSGANNNGFIVAVNPQHQFLISQANSDYRTGLSIYR